jgi:undecaprenyl diphosphate synthase
LRAVVRVRIFRKKAYFCALVATLRDQIDPNRLPHHIAVIMDGNGRWAQQKGAARIFGHRNAIEAVKAISTGCAELGIGYLTLYAFSTENWGRPQEEVNGLLELLVNTLKSEISTLQENNVRLRAIGDLKSLPNNCNANLQFAIDATAANTGLTVVLALSYSGRWEITRAVREIAQDVADGKVRVSEIDDLTIESHLETAGMPDPELMIRTGGEMRISNFLLWQLAYTELWITKKFWPDFRKDDLHQAIIDYQQRERRFGKVLQPNA